jgi:hypothetical protein
MFRGSSRTFSFSFYRIINSRDCKFRARRAMEISSKCPLDFLVQHRRLSYSRHAVNDRDLSTQVNYKMHMNIRRMMGEHKHRHKRSKKLLKVSLARRRHRCYTCHSSILFSIIDSDCAGRQAEPRELPGIPAERLDQTVHARYFARRES